MTLLYKNVGWEGAGRIIFGAFLKVKVNMVEIMLLEYLVGLAGGGGGNFIIIMKQETTRII